MSNVTRRKKTLTRDSDPKSLPVYDCEYFSDEDVKENLGRIKLIKNFQEMFNEITRTIHSLPDLFKDDLELQHVKIYLGRTGYLENTGNRHFDNLNLPYIVPVIRVKTENVKAFEKWGILLIQKIQQNEVLCPPVFGMLTSRF